MNSASTRRQEAIVGTFVIIAAGLLIATIFSLTGFFNRGDVPYRAFFKNAGGLRPGAEVRYAGGPPVGRIQDVRTDAHDTTRMEIIFRVKPDIPVKTDSTATITSNSPLSDNFLGIVPGTNAAPRAPAGSTLKSNEYVGFGELEAEIAELGPQAKILLGNLNDGVTLLLQLLKCQITAYGGPPAFQLVEYPLSGSMIISPDSCARAIPILG